MINTLKYLCAAIGMAVALGGFSVAGSAPASAALDFGPVIVAVQETTTVPSVPVVLAEAGDEYTRGYIDDDYGSGHYSDRTSWWEDVVQDWQRVKGANAQYGGTDLNSGGGCSNCEADGWGTNANKN